MRKLNFFFTNYYIVFGGVGFLDLYQIEYEAPPIDITPSKINIIAKIGSFELSSASFGSGVGLELSDTPKTSGGVVF